MGRSGQQRFPLADVHRYIAMTEINAFRYAGRTAGILQGRQPFWPRQRLGQNPAGGIGPSPSGGGSELDYIRKVQIPGGISYCPAGLVIMEQHVNLRVSEYRLQFRSSVQRVQRYGLGAGGMGGEHRDTNIRGISISKATRSPDHRARAARIANRIRPRGTRCKSGGPRRRPALPIGPAFGCSGEHMHDGWVDMRQSHHDSTQISLNTSSETASRLFAPARICRSNKRDSGISC